MDALQKFQGGTETISLLEKGKFHLEVGSYKPACDMWDLSGERERLILIPRNHLKTTLMAAHVIQWILNYPNVRVLMSSGTGDQCRNFIRGIKEHFQTNEKFRYFFPDYVPHGKNAKEFGNQESFTVPNRNQPGLKEPTISTCSVGSVVAGGHFDIIVNDDLVDKENVRTPEQIQTVKDHFGYLDPLLQRVDKEPNQGWTYVVGTRYDYSDLYGELIDAEAKKGDKSQWKILVQSAVVEGSLDKPETCKTLWPSRFPPRELLRIANDPTRGWPHLSSQYLMNPIPGKSGLIEDQDELRWIPRKDLDPLLPRLTQRITIDLAGMEPSTNKLADNDYTVINHHGFGQDGRLYINRLWRGRYTPHEVIELLFAIYKQYPQVLEIKVSKDHFARVLLPFLKREMVKRSIWLPVTEAAIDNRISKQQKIKGLQPWFRMKSIVWAEDIECRLDVINEIMRFPKYSHDDILDTVCDAMVNREGDINSDVTGRPKSEQEVREQASPLPQAITWAILEGKNKEQESQHDLYTGW